MAVLDTVASAQRAIHVDAPLAIGSSSGTTSVLIEACPLIERRDIEKVEVRVCLIPIGDIQTSKAGVRQMSFA